VRRMVARTAGRSRGRFLGRASKPRSSRDYVGAESWVEIGGGYTEFAVFAVVHQNYSVEPQNRGRRLDEEVRPPRPVQPLMRGGQTAPDRPGRWCREASKRRTHVGIARLASRLSRLR
jgi:hypothetical protein